MQRWSGRMLKLAKLIRPVFATILGSAAVAACGSADNDYYYGYPWYYTRYGTYTVVRRPAVVVDGWTTRVWRGRPYRGWRVRTHHSNPIVYTATKGNQTLEVFITSMEGDQTRLEVKARKGEDHWNQAQAKALLGQIMRESKSDKAAADK